MTKGQKDKTAQRQQEVENNSDKLLAQVMASSLADLIAKGEFFNLRYISTVYYCPVFNRPPFGTSKESPPPNAN